MVLYITGVPGSGKSYYGVYTVYANLGKNKRLQDKKYKIRDYKTAYTNINELKKEEFILVQDLDFVKLQESLNTLYSFYIQKATDKELIAKAKELQLFDTFFLIDEAHNFFNSDNEVLVWWFSYHRHLHHDIILMTQDLSLVEKKYLAFSEFYLQAVPSSLKLFKNKMVYIQYTSPKLYQKTKAGSKKIPFKKEIFATYHSGFNQQSENILKKFALLAIILIIGFGVVVLLVSRYISPTQPQQENQKLQSPKTPTYLPKFTKSIPPKRTNLKQLLKIYCSNDFCFNETIQVDRFIFDFYLKEERAKKLHFKYFNIKFNEYIFLVSSKFEDKFKTNKRRFYNEKNSTNSIFNF